MRHMWAKSLTQPAVPKRWRLPRCLGDQVRHLLLLTHDVPKRTHRIQRASGSSPSVRFHALVKFTGVLYCRAYYSRPAHNKSYCGLFHLSRQYPLIVPTRTVAAAEHLYQNLSCCHTCIYQTPTFITPCLPSFVSHLAFWRDRQLEGSLELPLLCSLSLESSPSLQSFGSPYGSSSSTAKDAIAAVCAARKLLPRHRMSLGAL